jgi:vacuolar-type H+-ATPase subunit H
MPSFETMGRRLDRELERLREVAKQKIKPATRQKAARALRSVSSRLASLAEDIEAHTPTKEQ